MEQIRTVGGVSEHTLVLGLVLTLVKPRAADSLVLVFLRELRKCEEHELFRRLHLSFNGHNWMILELLVHRHWGG